MYFPQDSGVYFLYVSSVDVLCKYKHEVRSVFCLSVGCYLAVYIKCNVTLRELTVNTVHNVMQRKGVQFHKCFNFYNFVSGRKYVKAARSEKECAC